MAESYDTILKITVIKSSSKETVVEEETYFNSYSFGKMTEAASEYYALVSKLQKTK